jgi:hypothetical protein
MLYLPPMNARPLIELRLIHGDDGMSHRRQNDGVAPSVWTTHTARDDVMDLQKKSPLVNLEAL